GDGAPGEERGPALHRPATAELHDAGAAPDRRHGPLVLVLERLRVLARYEPRDVLARVFAGLQGHRAELRQHLVRLRVGDPGDVADRERVRMTGDAEVGPDGNPVAPLQLEPERLRDRVRLQAGAPDERVRRNLL